MQHAERGNYVVGVAVGVAVGAAVGAAVGVVVGAVVVAGNTQGHCLPAKADGRDLRSKSTLEKAPGCGKEKTRRLQNRPIGQSS